MAQQNKDQSSYLNHLERKAMRLEIKLQNMLKFNRKGEPEKETKQLHYELNNLWKQISTLARKG